MVLYVHQMYSSTMNEIVCNTDTFKVLSTIHNVEIMFKFLFLHDSPLDLYLALFFIFIFRGMVTMVAVLYNHLQEAT